MTKIITLILLLFWTAASFSQRTWIKAEVAKEIVNKLELSVSPQVRFLEKFELDEYFFDTNLEYKISKHIDIGAGYRLGNNINKKGETESFGRYNLDLKTDYSINRFHPRFRVRFTNADDFGDENDNIKYLRYRIELEYNIKKSNLEPYVLYELYHNLQKNKLRKGRFESGLMYKINKHHRINAFFRLHDYLKSNRESIIILGLSYKLDL